MPYTVMLSGKGPPLDVTVQAAMPAALTGSAQHHVSLQSQQSK